VEGTATEATTATAASSKHGQEKEEISGSSSKHNQPALHTKALSPPWIMNN